MVDARVCTPRPSDRNAQRGPVHSSWTDKIPVFVPRTGIDTLKHITDAFDVGWLGMGATTKLFEQRISAFSLRTPARPRFISLCSRRG
jgi:hypothetical protein